MTWLISERTVHRPRFWRLGLCHRQCHRCTGEGIQNSMQDIREGFPARERDADGHCGVDKVMSEDGRRVNKEFRRETVGEIWNVTNHWAVPAREVYTPGGAGLRQCWGNCWGPGKTGTKTNNEWTNEERTNEWMNETRWAFERTNK